MMYLCITLLRPRYNVVRFSDFWQNVGREEKNKKK